MSTFKFKPCIWTLVLLMFAIGCVTNDEPSSLASRTLASDVISNNGAPEARASHSSAWTGKGMIVFGGMADDSSESANEFRESGIFYTGSGKWRSLPRSGKVPSYHHSATWTGQNLFVFGGINAYGDRIDEGLILNWGEKEWTPMTKEGAPEARSGHSAVWTGDKLIVFGGESEQESFADSYFYDFIEDAWEKTSGVRIDPRSFHTAVWTGSKMIVWGGLGNNGPLGDGAIYDPSTNKWKRLPKKRAPKARYGHTAVWTGSQMIVWGGKKSSDEFYSDGAAYDPVKNKWKALPKKSAPAARELHTATWTGKDMIVWGGYGEDGAMADGSVFNPLSNSWQSIEASDATPRYMHTAVWSGEHVILFGGRTTNGRFITENRTVMIPFVGTAPTNVYTDEEDEEESTDSEEVDQETDESDSESADELAEDAEDEEELSETEKNVQKALHKRHKTRTGH